MSNDFVAIPMREYKHLLDEARIMQCLRNQGVDNWMGWDDAMGEYNAESEQ